ncbi:MAG: ABC transporter permease [Lachnospiraceae bacterium]|nr:ABC transporter permease [Lachnospiraceae bacterium]
MYILKNAIKNLGRNKGRSFMVMIIAALTLTSVILSFSIKTISDLAVARCQERFFVEATIDYDWEKLEKDFPPKITENKDGSITQESSFELPEISLEDYLKYADSKYVKGAQYYAACNFACDTLTRVPDNTREGEEWVSLEGMTLDEIMIYFGISTKEELLDSGIIGNEDELQRILDSKGDLVGSLIGYTDLSIVDDFTDNGNKLESGHFPEKDNECIVSSKYAEHNKLNIGDTISISGPSKSDTKTMSLTITGIYAAHRAEANAETLGDVYGHVYTTFNTLKNSGFHYIWVGTVVYQLGNPEDAELFEKELHEKGLNKYYVLSVSNSSDEYIKNTEPLKNISHIAEMFTLAAGLIGAGMLLFVSFFNIRERRYEVGVLKAMGMKKTGVARGMVYETLIIMFLSFIFSVLLGLFLTKPIAVALLGDLTGVNLLLPPAAILLGAAMAFLFSVLAGLYCVFAVMRHEPMRMLAERN